MCSWAAYVGPDIWLEDLVVSPCHSLIHQSHGAVKAKTSTNGDGFGIAWYGERPEPGIYRDILPAWSDPNLESLCRHIRSPMFMAHVRAATDGGISRFNCHPFASANWSFVHNGRIGDFERLRRPLESKLSDDGFANRHGNTDSELFFLLAFEAGIERNPFGAVLATVRLVVDTAIAADVEPLIRLAAAFADGDRIHAIRYSTDNICPSLYTNGMATGGFCVVSEPLDDKGAAWQAVPQGTFLTVDRNGMTLDAFKPMDRMAA